MLSLGHHNIHFPKRAPCHVQSLSKATWMVIGIPACADDKAMPFPRALGANIIDEIPPPPGAVGNWFRFPTNIPTMRVPEPGGEASSMEISFSPRNNDIDWCVAVCCCPALPTIGPKPICVSCVRTDRRCTRGCFRPTRSLSARWNAASSMNRATGAGSKRSGSRSCMSDDRFAEQRHVVRGGGCEINRQRHRHQWPTTNPGA